MNFFSPRHIAVFLLSGILGGIVFLGIEHIFFPVQQKVVLFATVYSADEKAPTSEKEQSSAYFAETLVGWTRDPVFREEVFTNVSEEGSFSARKQERQNVIFIVSAKNKSTAETLSKNIETNIAERIDAFNIASHEFYGILFSESLEENSSPNSLVFFLFGIFVGLFAMVLFSGLRHK